ncbi:MAG: hypothetical protein KF900_12185 [Bacteroidetes bacterium]|nr:hypothetical protein [Bacteroidota bacterium]
MIELIIMGSSESLTNSEKEKNDRFKKRFIRWDSIRRNYFSVIINLFLTYSLGMLAFLFQKLEQPYFIKNCFFTTSLIFTSISVIVGIFASISRFFDFKITAKKIRLQQKQKDRNISDEEIENAKKKMNFYEILTIRLFYSQIVIFILSSISIIIYVLTKYGSVLF